jgi:uncharacterized repeat protein (TIGR01451 family)
MECDMPFPAADCVRRPLVTKSIWRKLCENLVIASWCFSLGNAALAQVAVDFDVTVNLGATPPNSGTVLPGEATSMRITLKNNSTTVPLTGVTFSKALPSAIGNTSGLLVNGTGVITGSPSCLTGTLTTNPQMAGISLSGLTIPVSGECYLDIPIVAFSTNGVSTSLSYELAAGAVASDQGSNASGGPQAYTIQAASRPTWSKSFIGNDLHVIGGTTRTLRITVNNNDSRVPLTGIAFTDVFPAAGTGGAIIEPTGAPATGTCSGSVVLTSGSAAQVAVSNVDLGTSSSCTIDIETRARHSNAVYTQTSTNTIPATGFTSDQGLRPAGNATSQVRSRSPLAVNKVFNPSIVTSGQPNIFTITLTNNGDVALPVTNFTDDPISRAPHVGQLSIANSTDISNNCGGTATRVSGGAGFSVGNFTIPIGGNCQIEVTYTGTTPGSDTPTTYTNQIAEGDVQTSVGGIVSQARSATVLVSDRLRVLKSASPTNAAPGDPVRYTVTIENYSANAISAVDVVDVLQNNSSLLLAGSFSPTLTPACGTLGLNGAVEGDTSVTFTIPTLPARSITNPNMPGTCVIGFSAMLDPEGTTDTTNTIAAGAVCFGGTCNSVASGTTTTNNLQTLTLNKTFDGANSVIKSEGTPTRLRLVLTNESISALSNLTISDTLPTAGPFQQLRVATPANITNTCGGTVVATQGSTSVALNSGTVPASISGTAGTCRLELDVVGPAGVYPNTANTAAVHTNGDGSTTTVSDDDDATLTYTDALNVSKFFTPGSTGNNGGSTATIRLTNLDTSRPITGARITDNLPVGMLVATPDNAYTTCGGNNTVTAVPGSGVVTLAGATIAPGSVCDLRFDVTVTGTSDWVNTIPPGGITADNGLNNRSAVTGTLAFEAAAEPLISKSISPGTIVPGEAGLLTISITNGAQNLTNLEVTDYFTADGTPGAAANGMRIAPAPGATTDCADGVVTASPNGNAVSLSGATLPSGAACQVQVMVTSTTVGTITNTIPMNSIVTDQGATNSSTFAQSTLATSSSIGVSKLFEPMVVSPSEPSRLRITLYNTQEEALNGLSLTDTFPAGLELAADPQGFSNCGGGVNISFPTTSSVMMTGGSIAAVTGSEASSCVIEANVVSNIEGTYRNTIDANTLLSNGNPVPHPPTTAVLEVRERLIVNKAIDGLTVDTGNPNGFTTGVAARLPGDPAPLTIRIENPNTAPLTEVTFTDVLPEGLFLSLTPALSTTCTDGSVSGVASGNEIRLTGATLGAAGAGDAICTVTANVVSNIPGVYTNEVPLGGVTSYEGIVNDPLTQARIIITEPPGISKDFTPPVAAPGETSTLTLMIANDNDLSTTLTTALVDNLPGSPDQMTVANPSSISTTCPGNINDIVTAVADATSITIASGSTIPPDGCLVTVQVTAPTPGEYLNYIPVGALNTTFGVNESPAEASLLVSTRGYISGKVFLDNQTAPNGNYIPGGSTPIDGNTIELRSGANCTGPILDTASTDLNGNYLFSDLPAGSYSVCQPTQPPGSVNSFTQAGTIERFGGSVGAASNPVNGTPTSQIVNIVLDNNGDADQVSGSPDNNFSETLPVSIAGNVYHDANNNGVFDPNENGIAGVTITLSGPVNTSVTTNPDGSYSFVGLPPGEYTVVETQPAPWIDGIDTVGTVDGVPRGNSAADDTFTAIVLSPGDVGIEYNFGETIDSAALAINASSFCATDAPQINYAVPALSGSGTTVTLSWYTVDGRLVETLEGQPASGTLLWPGVVVDGSGTGVAWPGYEFIDGKWVAVMDDRIPQMELRVALSASAETTVTYPPNSTSCLTQPPGTFSVAVPTTPQPVLWILALMMCITGLWRFSLIRS